MSDFTRLLHKDEFVARHIGPDESAERQMLQAIGVASLDALVREVVPQDIVLQQPLALGAPEPELQALA